VKCSHFSFGSPPSFSLIHLLQHASFPRIIWDKILYMRQSSVIFPCRYTHCTVNARMLCLIIQYIHDACLRCELLFIYGDPSVSLQSSSQGYDTFLRLHAAGECIQRMHNLDSTQGKLLFIFAFADSMTRAVGECKKCQESWRVDGQTKYLSIW